MKKLKLNLLNLEGAEVLTRQQLKMVMGGSGDDGDGEVGSGGGGYKCCWDHDRDNCSVCVPAAEPTCVKGAHAVAC